MDNNLIPAERIRFNLFLFWFSFGWLVFDMATQQYILAAIQVVCCIVFIKNIEWWVEIENDRR